MLVNVWEICVERLIDFWIACAGEMSMHEESKWMVGEKGMRL